MKKTYSEPDIVFESFSLSSNIAAGCELKPDNSREQCGVQFGRATIFLESMTGCIRKIEDGDDTYDKLCYHVPSENYNVFLS